MAAASRRGGPRPPAAQADATNRGRTGSPTALVAVLLFVSGACALAYQITWMRMLRLVFGNSTAASAAVLAIFMGGLGIGAVVLGRRADAHPRPLRFYALLEAGIAAAAALTPLLVAATASLYVATGGSARLGMPGATALRLLLSVVVLGTPTVLMGGTLPAAARAIEAGGPERRPVAALYAANTLGAVAGVLASNFLLLEMLGTRATLLGAVAVNALLAAVAWSVSRPADPGPPAPEKATESVVESSAERRFVEATAAVAGAAFLLMELVWYRMLAPLLGGSTYTFGLVLALALLGVGVGGFAYSREAAGGRQRTFGRLAVVTALEAACAMLPFALGDRIALLAISLQSLAPAGFDAMVFVWCAIASVVVLPMSLVAGYQFPLLVALVGSRKDRLGSDVGRVYGFNTAGAIAGSLAGGFGLLPGLGATGAWKAAAASLVAVAAAGAWIAARRGEGARPAVAVVVAASLAVAMGLATGPTAVWRHTPIGGGITALPGGSSLQLRRFLYDTRRSVAWEQDGVESAVAVTDEDGVSLRINGKSDGNAFADASTNVMAGMLPALFHAGPKRVLVVGLGLGTTAGWLARVPGVERIDVVELEPAVLRAARDAAAVNFDVLSDPRVHVVIGDAREFLLTARGRYDVIVSEPSNPYRAGVASLFTTEYYEAVRSLLRDGGIFAQWVQAYAVDSSTLRTVVATLASVFDPVEAWEVQLGSDLLLMARDGDEAHDVARLRERLGAEPYRSALDVAWGLAGVDGLYTGYVAGPAMAARIRDDTPASRLNTDDSTVIEFEFARSLGRMDRSLVATIRQAVSGRAEFAPSLRGGDVDWRAVDELRAARAIHEEKPFSVDHFEGSPEALSRMRARYAFAVGRLDEARQWWDRQAGAPVHPGDVRMLAEVLAAAADPRSLALAEQLRETSEADAEAVLALHAERLGDLDAATRHLEACYAALRASARGDRPLARRAVAAAWRVASTRTESVEPLLAALDRPFAARLAEDQRVHARLSIALQFGPPADCASALAGVEPWVLFERDLLAKRVECYRRLGHPLLGRARRDLDEFDAAVGPAVLPVDAP